MIEPMNKIEIVGLLDELDRTLDFLQHNGTVQIDEIPAIKETGDTMLHRIHLDESKKELLEKYEELLSNVTEILDIMKAGNVKEVSLDDETEKQLQKLSSDELIDYTTQISRKIRRLARQRNNLNQDLESARQYETLVNIFLPLLEKTESIDEMEQIGIILKGGEVSVLPILRDSINEATGPDTIFLHQKMPDGRIGVFIAVPYNDLPAVRQLLGSEGVGEYHIPREFRKNNLQESIEAIRIRIENIPDELTKIDENLLEEKKSNISVLRLIHSLSSNRLNQLRILSRLVRTNYTFVISGWTPATSVGKLEKGLIKNFGERVYIGKVKLNDLDFQHMPTLLRNRGVFKSFELLMKLLPPPKYGNIDATPFIAVFFPIFFGIILGDIAYGLALLAVAGLMKWKWRKGGLLSDAGTVALAAGVSTVIFGILFGEFLGELGENFGIRPLAPWLHRIEAIQIILFIALGLGTVHVFLGFILKIYLGILMRHVKGVIEGISKISVILGLILMLAQLFLGLSLTIRYVSYMMMSLGMIGVVFTEGILGIIEIFSNIGNILSYSRIMAIGLSSAMLAFVANRLAESSRSIVAAILIGFIIHLINFIMGVFSSTIHSLRLHYVEFFSKFFMPSGKEFKPFNKIGEDFS
ncbi:V-type ATP synthase subunit I [Candidatus Latescibacterota bacterium]